MRKKSGSMPFGRVNPPPLNWENPARPPVLPVAGDSENWNIFDSKTEVPGLVSVYLTHSEWVKILEMLDLYEQNHQQDAGEQKLGQRVRETLLAAVGGNENALGPRLADLPVEDWREVYRRVRQTCLVDSRQHRTWFGQVGEMMVQQIWKQTGKRKK